ncbi:hypothetical protein [Enterococcus phage vB_Efm3_KEN20]
MTNTVSVLIKSSKKETQYRYGKELINIDRRTLQQINGTTSQVFVASEPQRLLKDVSEFRDGLTYSHTESIKINPQFIWYVDDMPNMRNYGNLFK